MTLKTVLNEMINEYDSISKGTSFFDAMSLTDDDVDIEPGKTYDVYGTEQDVKDLLKQAAKVEKAGTNVTKYLYKDGGIITVTKKGSGLQFTWVKKK